MLLTIDGSGGANGHRFAIIRSRFNETVTKRLLQGAIEALHAGGVPDEAIEVVSVPGAFEIPVVAAKLAASHRYDAVICLGAVIRGETPHFEYISAEVSRGIGQVAYDYQLPVVFGIITADTEEQADARSGIDEEGMPGVVRCNRGCEAAVTAIEMANLMKRLPARKRLTSRMGRTSGKRIP